MQSWAAIGSVQLSKLERNNEQRRHLVQCYRDSLQEFAQISVPFHAHPRITSAHIMPILLSPKVDRLHFMEQMKIQGIQTSIHYPPVHTFSAYASEKDHGCNPLPITEDIATREVTLPLYPGMTAEDVTIVTEAISKSLP